MIYKLNEGFSEGLMETVDEEYKNKRLAELGVTITYYYDFSRTVFWDSEAAISDELKKRFLYADESSEKEIVAALERCEFSRGARRITEEEKWAYTRYKRFHNELDMNIMDYLHLSKEEREVYCKWKPISS